MKRKSKRSTPPRSYSNFNFLFLEIRVGFQSIGIGKEVNFVNLIFCEWPCALSYSFFLSESSINVCVCCSTWNAYNTYKLQLESNNITFFLEKTSPLQLMNSVHFYIPSQDTIKVLVKKISSIVQYWVLTWKNAVSARDYQRKCGFRPLMFKRERQKIILAKLEIENHNNLDQKPRFINLTCRLQTINSLCVPTCYLI